ncbi:hypothetical protein [Candidatus Desulfovibrio trichonymphae]|uniref:hypothetical protein n=1 Tax=Candidatus Desulfovibrio trichonymphae TaxID=1725232 RepID=UPI0015516545|nr:hypothetical protein [Candidatus Desulfovibrio trichonymphae]GHU98651.1 hypothetical protein AGMMS50248_05550 [Deltaproteobacteria bacterium]
MPKVPVLGGATGLVGQALTRVLAKHGFKKSLDNGGVDQALTRVSAKHGWQVET